MADILNARFDNNLYYKIIVVTDVALKCFLEYSMTSFAKVLHGSDVLIHVATSSLLRFHRDKICITVLVALSSLYVPKIIEFCSRIQLLA